MSALGEPALSTDFLAVRGVLRGERAVPDELVLACELRHERPG